MVIKCREAINSFLENRIKQKKKKKYLPSKGGSVNKRKTKVTSEATGKFQVPTPNLVVFGAKCDKTSNNLTYKNVRVKECENHFLIFSIRNSASASQIY